MFWLNVQLIEYRKCNISEEYESCVILVWLPIILNFLIVIHSPKIIEKDSEFLKTYLDLSEKASVNEGNSMPEFEIVLEVY